MEPDPYRLERLNDIVTPGPVSWWPLAPGWYFLLALVLLWSAIYVGRAAARWQRNAYRRCAIRELAKIAPGDFYGVSSLLKRVALVSFQRDRVAGLAGDDWLAFLSTSSQNVDFLVPPFANIGTASSRPESQPLESVQWNQVTMVAAAWIRHHRSEDTR